MLVIDVVRLESVLKARGGVEALLSCDRLSAGASRETYRLVVRMGGVERKLALRRAEQEASAMKQGPGLSVEAKLFVAAREAGVPGPEVLVMLKPEDQLGLGFVMEWIDGETLGARIARGEAYAGVRPKLARQCGEILARLHAVDVEASGLGDALEAMTPEQCVRRTHETYLALGSSQPMIDFTAMWLKANLPKERKPALVHSDFRNGNLIVSPDEGVKAVLDWELAYVGDPMRDLGWLCTRSWRFGSGAPVGGFGEYEDLFAGYEAVSGEAIDREAVRFWEVFGSFWWAVGTLSMGQSFRDGSEPSVERPAIGRRSSECQIDCVNMLIPGAAEPPRAQARTLSTSDLPTSEELLVGVRDFLKGDAAAAMEGRNAFLARVAANALDIVVRELKYGGSADARANAELAALLGVSGETAELRAKLCASLRAGEIALESETLHAFLRADVLAQVLIDQPGYAGTVEALGRG